MAQSPELPCAGSVQVDGRSGRFCSWANPMAWPNSCTAMVSMQYWSVLRQSGLQLLNVKFSTMPWALPLSLLPSSFTCGPSSLMAMRMPEDVGGHAPHPAKRTPERASHVRATALRTHCRCMSLPRAGFSQHTGTVMGLHSVEDAT